MPDQTTEQLVIEAKLRDLFTPEARRVSASLKGLEKDLVSLNTAASTGTGTFGQGLALAVPQVRRVGSELSLLRGGATAAASAVGGIATAAGEGEAAMLGMSAAGGPLALAITAAAIGGYELVRHLTKAHEEAVAFKAAMQGVFIRSDISAGGNLDDFTERLERLAKTTKISKEVLAQGGTEILKDFSRSQGDAIVILEETARVAKASGEDITKAFGGIAGVLSAYGFAARDAGRVSKELFAVALDGKSDLGEVAQVMEKLGPATRELGFDFQHTLAAVLAMSQGAGGLREAGSALESLFNRLLADKGLQTRLQAIDSGFDATGKNGNNLISILNDLQQVSGGSNTELASLFGGVRGASAAMALASTNADSLTAAYKTLAGATDVVDDKLRLIGALDAGSKLGGIAGSMSNARKQGLLAALQGDEQGVNRWIDEYARLADAADESAKSQVASLQDVRAELERTLAKPAVIQSLGVSPEVAAKAQELFNQIHARTLVGLERQAADQRIIEESLKRQIAAFEGQGSWMGKLTAQLHLLKDAHVEALGLADERERLAINQQLASETEKNLKLEQERAVAAGDLNEAAHIGEQILTEHARAQSADTERTIAGLMEQRRAYPKIADAIDAIIGKLRERQFLEGQSARSAAEKANEAAQAAQVARVIAAEEQLQAVRNDSLTGLERELALIEASHSAAIRKAQDEAKLDAEKAKRLQNLILLLDGEAVRQKEAATKSADVAFLRMEADLAMRVAQSSAERLLAFQRIRTLERQSLIDQASSLGKTSEQIRALEDLFDRESLILGNAIAGGFREGMDEALRVYSDTAQRMLEAGRSMIQSFHDEGSRALSDLLKGDLSGGDALRQFGQNFLGNIIDQGTSALFDQITTGIFGSGLLGGAGGLFGGGKDMQVRANNVTVIGGAGGAGGGLLGGLLGGLFGGGGGDPFGGFDIPSFFADGGVARGPQLAMVGDNSSRMEAIVPLPGAGRGIPVEFRGRGRAGGVTIHQALSVNLTVHSVDPRGAADVVLAQMPQIQRALTSVLVRGSDRAFRDAVQGAAR